MNRAWTLVPPQDRSAPLPRAERLPKFIAQRAEAEALDGCSVCIVGAGSVGGRWAAHCARMGLGTIGVVDDGFYKPQSVATHDIAPDAIGLGKAMFIGRLCKSISPASVVRTFSGPIESLPIEAMFDCDVVAMATDNLRAEAEVGRRCIHLGVPLLQASVHGSTLVAQVRVFTGAAGGACPMCGFNDEEWADLSAQVRFSCQGASDGAPAALRKKRPTMSTSALCSLAADLGGITLMRHVLKIGPVLEDCVIEYAGHMSRMTVTRLARNPSCPCDHHRWERKAAPGNLMDCTVEELVVRAGLGSGSAVDLDVGGLAFVERGICGCGRAHPVFRFTTAGESAGVCDRCGSPVLAQPFYTHQPAPARLLESHGNNRLGELTRQTPAWVLVSNADRSVLLSNPTEERS